MSSEPVFSRKKRVLLRKQIPAAEVLVGVAVLAGLVAAIAWVVTQAGNFDAGERDLPYEVLARQPVEDRLYRQPLKRWVPPRAGEAVPSVAERVELGALPGSLLDGGWALSARPRRFDSENLFEKIDGEAERFIRQGFQELDYVAVRAPTGDGELAIELFDQGSFAGAVGIFSDHRTEDTVAERQGGAVYFRTPVGAIGFSGRYFFRIVGSAETEAIREKTTQLVRAFAELPDAETEPPLPYRVLTRGMGVDPGWIAYQRDNVFQYDFAEDFWFGRLDPTQPARLFLHQAASPEAGARLFRKIVAEHEIEFNVLERGERRALLRHEFLKTHFSIAVEGSLVYGMENEPRPDRVGRLMEQYAETLRREGQTGPAS